MISSHLSSKIIAFQNYKTPSNLIVEYRTWSESNNNHEILGDGQNLVYNEPNSSNCALCILLYSGPTEWQHRHMCQKCSAEQSASAFLTSDWTCMLAPVNGHISVSLAELSKVFEDYIEFRNRTETRTNNSSLPSECPGLSVSKSFLCSTLLVQRNMICFI